MLIYVYKITKKDLDNTYFKVLFLFVFQYFHFIVAEYLVTAVDSLSFISPLSTTSSAFLPLSAICSIRSLQASSAICSTGCSTAVMVGCTSVQSAVPDMQHYRNHKSPSRLRSTTTLS